VEKKNPNISFDGSPFYIQDKLQDWVLPLDKGTNGLPRRATVSSFGAGGSYSHIILEEYTMVQSGVNAVEKAGSFVVPLSARNWYDLREMSISLLDFIRNNKTEIDSFSKTLLLGRTEMKCRMAFVAHTMEEVATALDHFIQQDNPQTFSVKDMTVFVNNSDVEKHEFKELLSDTEGDLYLKSLIDGKKYNKLALLWTCGSFRGWENIVERSNASFITLPNYPFNYGKYWVQSDAVMQEKGEEEEEEKGKEKEKGEENRSPLKLIADFLENELNFKPGSYSKEKSLNSFFRS
jgi:acyl transferase domain-containing protein